MKCIYCGCAELKVIDSRPVEESNAIRRRRECTNCGKRFTTYETVEETQLLVIKTTATANCSTSTNLKTGLSSRVKNVPFLWKNRRSRCRYSTKTQQQSRAGGYQQTHRRTRNGGIEKYRRSRVHQVCVGVPSI